MDPIFGKSVVFLPRPVYQKHVYFFPLIGNKDMKKSEATGPISVQKLTPEWDMKNLFVDWLTLSAENYGRWPVVNDGYVIKYDSDGNEEYTQDYSLKKTGSYDSSAQIRVTHERLTISFNPSRYNRSDNLFGCRYENAVSVVNQLLRELGLAPLETFKISRIDLTLNVSTGSKEALGAYLRALKRNTMPRMKTRRTYESAIYDNTRKRITVYNKEREMKAHGLGDWKEKFKKRAFSYEEAMEKIEHQKKWNKTAEYCQTEGLARVELRLKRGFIQEAGIKNGHELTHEKLEEIFKKEIEKMPKKIDEVDLEELDNGPLGTFLAWKNGFDVRNRISKNTFTAHKRQIKEVTGYDISCEPPVRFKSKKKKVTTRATEIPNWYDMPKKMELVK